MIRSILFNICFMLSIALLGLFSPFAIVPTFARYISNKWTHFVIWLFKVICRVDYEIKGRQYISKDKPVIYAVKHQSAWETLALYFILNGPSFILKRELQWIPFLGIYGIQTGMIAINRKGGIKSFKKMIMDTKKQFAKNHSLVIFPEGTRTVPGEIPKYKHGVYSMYEALRCEVVPVALNSGVYWSRRSFHKYPGKIIVEFMPAIKPGLRREEFMKILEDKIENTSRKLLPKPKLFLLDRDGVINVNSPMSIRHIKEFKFLPGAIEAIQLLNQQNIKVAIVTNQAIVGRGHISDERLQEIHAHMCAELEKEDAYVDHIFYCPDTPEAKSYRRKPNPGMLEEAMEMFKAIPPETPMIGDDIRDLQAAYKIGCPRHVVLTGHGEETIKKPEFTNVQPVYIHKDLLAAVKFILKD